MGPIPLEQIIGHLDNAGGPVRGGWWSHAHPHHHDPDHPGTRPGGLATHEHPPEFSHTHKHRWWPDPDQHHDPAADQHPADGDVAP